MTDYIDNLIADMEAYRAIAKDAIGRLQNVQFDIEHATEPQALANVRVYVKLTRDAVKALDDKRNERSVARARKALQHG